MNATDSASRLQKLHEASDRISANVVDLELDAGRQLLETTTLQGRSAERWAEASAALTHLWNENAQLQELVRRAGELRGARHGAELAALLNGPSIELAGDHVPIAERHLLGSPRDEQRCTPDQLLVRMSDRFDRIKATIAEIGGAWDRLTPPLDVAQRAAANATRLATELGEPDGAGLGGLTTTLNAAGAKVTSDPLSIDVAEVEQLCASLADLVGELETALALKRGFERELLEARRRLASLKTELGECASVRAEMVLKISGVAASPDPGPHTELERELDTIAEMAERGAWREAARTLEAWGSQVDSLAADAAKARAADRAPIEARNQLRAVFEAYRVKATRLGLVEDPTLAEISDQAERVLYTAPTDLRQAAELVRAYREALRPPQTEDRDQESLR
jgi:hypothetical protein